jgi:hypothetical protein
VIWAGPASFGLAHILGNAQAEGKNVERVSIDDQLAFRALEFHTVAVTRIRILMPLLPGDVAVLVFEDGFDIFVIVRAGSAAIAAANGLHAQRPIFADAPMNDVHQMHPPISQLTAAGVIVPAAEAILPFR